MSSGSMQRIISQVYKGYLQIWANGFRLFDVTIWPLVLFLSTTLFAYFITEDKAVIGMIVLGALGWRVLYHFQMEPVQGIMDEHWDNSLEHLMISPIRLKELILGGLVTSCIKATIVGTMFLVLGWLLFGFTVSNPGMIAGALLAVVFCGIIFTLFSIGVAFLYGSDSYAFMFAFADTIAVLSGVFYPISVFPSWLQKIVMILPTTHAFNIFKESVGLAQANMSLLLLTLVLWFIIAIVFINWAFKRARRQGKLVRMK